MALPTSGDVNRVTTGIRSGIFDLGEGVTPTEEFEFGIKKSKREEQEAIAKFGKKQIWLDVASSLANVFSDRDFPLAGSRGVERIRGRFGQERQDLLQQFNVALAGEQAQQRRARFEREEEGFDRAGKLRKARGAGVRRQLEGRTTPVELDVRNLPLPEEITNVIGSIMESMGVPSRTVIQQRDVPEEVIADVERQIELGESPEQAMKNVGVMTEDELFQREIDETELKVAQERLNQLEASGTAADYLGQLFAADTDKDRKKILADIEANEPGRIFSMVKQEYDESEWRKVSRELEVRKTEAQILASRAATANSWENYNLAKDRREELKGQNLLPADVISKYHTSGTKGGIPVSGWNAANDMGKTVFTTSKISFRVTASSTWKKLTTPEAQAQYRANVDAILSQGASESQLGIAKTPEDLKALAQEEAAVQQELLLQGLLTELPKTVDEIFDEWTNPRDGIWEEKGEMFWKKGYTQNELFGEKGYLTNKEQYIDDLLTAPSFEAPPTAIISPAGATTGLEEARETMRVKAIKEVLPATLTAVREEYGKPPGNLWALNPVSDLYSLGGPEPDFAKRMIQDFKGLSAEDVKKKLDKIFDTEDRKILLSQLGAGATTKDVDDLILEAARWLVDSVAGMSKD